MSMRIPDENPLVRVHLLYLGIQGIEYLLRTLMRYVFKGTQGLDLLSLPCIVYNISGLLELV